MRALPAVLLAALAAFAPLGASPADPAPATNEGASAAGQAAARTVEFMCHSNLDMNMKLHKYALDPEFKNPLAPSRNGGAPAGY